MELIDSRRLTGVNILWDRPGAVIDVAVEDRSRDELIEAWSRAVRRLLDALGWNGEQSCVRVYKGGASLAISAPIDGLYAATEVNESAWRSALAGQLGEAREDFEAELARLRAEIAAESNPALIRLRDAASEHGVQFLSDDDEASVGSGAGSMCWPVRELPAPEQIDWSRVHDIPVAMVTGTNGKTTTVRLLAAIVEAAGMCVGITSTDRVCVGHQVLEEGDWSGPGGARLVLRNRHTEVGLLETARGGMLRRGLALEHCAVSAVLNVGADHLGEWGVGTIQGLAEGKFIITRIADVVVLNADDEVVVKAAAELDKPIVWFSLDASNRVVDAHLAAGGVAWCLDEGALWRSCGTARERVIDVADVPIGFEGAARYNLANALAAAAIADCMGYSLEAVRTALRAFESDHHANPGRLNRFDLGGVDAIVDFAHNPHGFAALFDLVGSLPAQRRLVVLGQAGDRDADSIREMVRIAWNAQPDMIVIKELTEHLRGKPLGEIPALIESELRALGAPEDHFVHCATELEAVEWALAWAKRGDSLLLLTHDFRDEVLRRLDQLVQSGWSPTD